VGEPGAGKSALLAHWALACRDKALWDAAALPSRLRAPEVARDLLGEAARPGDFWPFS